MLAFLRDSLSSLLFPTSCRVCKNSVDNFEDGAACSDCWAVTRLFTADDAICEKCGAYFGRPGQGRGTFCGDCHDFAFEKARAVGVYEKALSASVLRLKHEPHIPKRLLSAIGEAIHQYSLADATSIIAVPPSRQRQFERGFNQAEIAARSVAALTGIPHNSISLRRTKNTPFHRVGMDKRARELTLERAFEVAAPRLVENERILLIDDVLTSGSTADACARVLKKSGATEVNVFTLARAVMNLR